MMEGLGNRLGLSCVVMMIKKLIVYQGESEYRVIIANPINSEETDGNGRLNYPYKGIW